MFSRLNFNPPHRKSYDETNYGGHRLKSSTNCQRTMLVRNRVNRHPPRSPVWGNDNRERKENRTLKLSFCSRFGTLSILDAKSFGVHVSSLKNKGRRGFGVWRGCRRIHFTPQDRTRTDASSHRGEAGQSRRGSTDYDLAVLRLSRLPTICGNGYRKRLPSPITFFRQRT